MRRTMLTVLLVVLGLYAGLCLLLVLTQERLVYFPDTSAPVRPPSAADVEELSLQTADDVTLSAWLVRGPASHGGPDSPDGPDGGTRSAVLFCHGNGGHLGSRLGAARAFAAMGHDVLLFDYRGYGASAGRPTEAGTYLDAEAAYDALRERGYAPGRIAVYGESLGGAVAIELARRRDVAAVVTESTFTSIPDMGAEVYPWLPARLISRIRYDNASKVADLTAPLLLIHSPEDGLVPFAHARTLLERARDGTELLETAGGHNDGGFLNRSAWTERVRAFLAASLTR